MMSINRDIIVAEWANIAKFSALEDLCELCDLTRIILYGVIADMIFGYTKSQV